VSDARPDRAPFPKTRRPPAGGKIHGRPVRIGLTGPIGCGKSTVASWLAAEGALVLDADAIARAVTAPGEPAHEEILARFGAQVRGSDGTLDRGALARIVFADPAALAELETIVHPAVRPRILAGIDAGEHAGAPAVVIEAIKLVEGGLGALCDEVWLVTCDPPRQRERMLARGMSPDDAGRRLAAQAGLAERLRPAAARVIDTSGTPEETAAAARAALVAAMHRRLA
jgi:dephospho-CoA kinase